MDIQIQTIMLEVTRHNRGPIGLIEIFPVSQWRHCERLDVFFTKGYKIKWSPILILLYSTDARSGPSGRSGAAAQPRAAEVPKRGLGE